MSQRRLFTEPLEPRRLLAADMVLHNPLDALDVDHNRVVVPLDALIVINEVNRIAAHPSSAVTKTAFVDTNNDRFLSPSDALNVINHLNAPRAGNAELSDRVYGLAGRLSDLETALDTAAHEMARKMTRYAAEHDGAVEILHRRLDGVLKRVADDADGAREELDRIAAARKMNESVLKLRLAYLDDHIRDDFKPFADQYLNETTEQVEREWTSIFDDAEHGRDLVAQYLQETMAAHRDRQPQWTMDDVFHGDLEWTGVIDGFFGDEMPDRPEPLDIESWIAHVRRGIDSGQIELNERLKLLIKPYLADSERLEERLGQWLASADGAWVSDLLHSLHERLLSGERLGLSDLEPFIDRLLGGGDRFPPFGIA